MVTFKVKLTDRTKGHPAVLSKRGYDVTVVDATDDGYYLVKANNAYNDTPIEIGSDEEFVTFIKGLVEAKAMIPYKQKMRIRRVKTDDDGNTSETWVEYGSITLCTALESLREGASAFVGKPTKGTRAKAVASKSIDDIFA